MNRGNRGHTAASVGTMASADSREESPAVSLVFGLIAIVGLLYISVLALGSPWLGILAGLIELAVAWRVTPPAGARALRVVALVFGACTVAWSVFRLILR